MLKKSPFVFIAAALLLAGCAMGPDHPAIDWKHGARRGYIAQFYKPDTPAADLPECLATLSKTELGERHFVRVRYKHARHMVTAIVEVSDTAQLKINQQVEVYPDDCTHGKFGHIGQIFS